MTARSFATSIVADRRTISFCLALLFLPAFFTSAVAQETASADHCKEAPAQAVVRIFFDPEFPLGTGVLITGEGHILTAAHVVEQALEVHVALPGGDGLTRAFVVGVNQLADVALLQLDRSATEDLAHAALLPLSDVQPGALLRDGWVCIVGYAITRQGTGAFEPKQQILFRLIEERGGFVRFQGEVREGFSGGAAFRRGRLLGIAQKSSRFGSRLLPARYLWSFLSQLGLQVETTGEVRAISEQNDLASLAVKLENTRRNVQRILTSVNWQVQPVFYHEPVSDEIVLWYDPVLPVQRIEGSISGVATPIFAGQEFKDFRLGNAAFSFEIYGPLENGKLHFAQGRDAIEHIIGKYRDRGIDLGWDDLEALELEFTVRAAESFAVLDPIRLKVGIPPSESEEGLQ